MTTAAERGRPIVAVLYRDALPPRLAEIEELADVRLTTADGLAEALDGADVLYQWHSFSPALQRNWDAATSLRWVHVSAAGVSQLLFDEFIDSDIIYSNSRGVLSRAIAGVCARLRTGYGQGCADLVPAAAAAPLETPDHLQNSEADGPWWSVPGRSAAKSPVSFMPSA
jgi:hypothetical protein